MEDRLNNTVLKVERVSMKFNLMEKKVDNLKEFVIKMLKNELRYQEFWALRNVNFSLVRGDRLGILGLNGAGKSTVLKIIAGVLKATEGKVTVKGKIVPLLELGAGFDPQYTGAENIYLYGALLGYSKEFIKSKYDEILEFSELGDFIHVPVKNYSSGMKARLGFSIATIVEPEILILDEVLSVGDAKFRKKSEKRIQEMFDSGVTVLFVSHSLDQIKRICNRAIILEKGTVIADGPVDEVAKLYESLVEDTDKIKVKKKKKKKKKKPVEVLENKEATSTVESGVEAPKVENSENAQRTEENPAAEQSQLDSPMSESLEIENPATEQSQEDSPMSDLSEKEKSSAEQSIDYSI